jgi:hypothetical protein
VVPGIFTPLEALAVSELTRSEADEAAPLALASVEAQLAEVAVSLTVLNCGQVPDPLKVSTAVTYAYALNGDWISTIPNEGKI